MFSWIHDKDTNLEMEMVLLLQKLHNVLDETREETREICTSLRSIQAQLRDMHDFNKHILNLLERKLAVMNENYARTHLWDLV